MRWMGSIGSDPYDHGSRGKIDPLDGGGSE